MELTKEIDNIPMQTKQEKSNYIPIWKFVILSIFTIGLYEIVWMYKNWKFQRDKYEESISPFWRSLFGLIFIYGLCKRAKESAQSKGYEKTILPGLSAIGFITLSFMSRLPSPFWLISYFSFVPLIPIVKAFNYYYTIEQHDAIKKTKLSVVEILVVIFGSMIVFLSFIGSFL